jgi:excisionase family DNA binding protein
MRYLSTKQAGEVIGVTQVTIQRMCAKGLIPFSDIGTPERARIRIAESDLIAYMDSKKSEPAA